MKALFYKLNSRLGVILGILTFIGRWIQAFEALPRCTLSCKMTKPSGTKLPW